MGQQANPTGNAGQGQRRQPPAAPSPTNPATPPAAAQNTGSPTGGAANKQGQGPRQGTGDVNGGATAPGARTTPGTTYGNAIDMQYGANNPFRMRGNYSDPNNPIYAAAKRNYDQTMAQQRARFGASGLGNSGREALAEGEGASNLAAQIAQIGEQAYQADKGTGLQAFLGAAQNQLGQNQLALQANQQLANLGTGLTGIGSQEQGIPNLGELMSFLAAFASSAGTGNNRSSGANGWAKKN